jgi:hypothetical protein
MRSLVPQLARKVIQHVRLLEGDRAGRSAMQPAHPLLLLLSSRGNLAHEDIVSDTRAGIDCGALSGGTQRAATDLSRAAARIRPLLDVVTFVQRHLDPTLSTACLPGRDVRLLRHDRQRPAAR